MFLKQKQCSALFGLGSRDPLQFRFGALSRRRQHYLTRIEETRTIPYGSLLPIVQLWRLSNHLGMEAS